MRHAALNTSSGWVRLVDLTTGSVIHAEPIPEAAGRADEPNPRGGARGARGLSVHGDRLVVANHERLFVLEPTWAVRDSFTHPWMGGIHDLLADADGILVTCANCDLLVRVGWTGEILDRWTWRGDRDLADALHLPRSARFDESRDYRKPSTMREGAFNTVHLNAVCSVPEGTIVSLGRIVPETRYRWRRMKGIVAGGIRRLGFEPRAEGAPARSEPLPAAAPTGPPVDEQHRSTMALVLLRHRPGGSLESATAEVVWATGPTSVPNHNVARLGDALLINDSNAGRLTIVDPDGRGIRASVAIPGNPPFARGLDRLTGDAFLVGSQAPAAIHEVHLGELAVRRSIDLRGAPAETVYAITVIPDGFGAVSRSMFAATSAGQRGRSTS